MKLKARTSALKAARKRTAYTQQDMAELLSAFFERDITWHTYSKWETGTRVVDLQMAKAISGIVEAPISKVFKSADSRIKFGADL